MNLREPNEDDTRELAESEEIARRAYALWEKSGCTHGHALDDWLAAERQFHGQSIVPDDASPPGLPAREPMPDETEDPEKWVRVPAIEMPAGSWRP